MSAAAIVSMLEHEGISIEFSPPDLIRIKPFDRLTPDMIGEIKSHKPQIITYLQQRHSAQDSEQDNGTSQDSTTSDDSSASDPADVTSHLTPLQRRALNGFNWLLQKRRDYLEATGRPVKNAAVPVREGRDAFLPTLCQVMGIEWWEADDLLRQLRKLGLISQSGGYLRAGDGVPVQQVNTDLSPDFILPDTSGRTFRLWLEGVDVWQVEAVQ